MTARSNTDETPKGAKFIKGDVSTNEGAKAIAAETLKALGGIDIIINNAGAARVHLQGTASIPDTEWQDALDMNFLSAVRVTNALLPALKESKAGAIVNLSSGGAAALPGPLGHYGAAKAALVVYSKTVARELAPAKIRVNTADSGSSDNSGRRRDPQNAYGCDGCSPRSNLCNRTARSSWPAFGNRRDGRLPRVRSRRVAHGP